jgi:hypothetical protein
MSTAHITPTHRERLAYVYVRQSTHGPRQRTSRKYRAAVPVAGTRPLPGLAAHGD